MLFSAISRLFGRAKALSDPARHWEHAYSIGGSPNAPRQTPSEAVIWAWEELQRHHKPVHHVVDAGCGKGRNALYLAKKGAHVTALDFAPGAIAQLKKSAQDTGLSDKVRALVYDVMDGWPVAQHSIDLVIDAFCFKHITGRDARLAYKQNIINALDVRGAYLISFSSIGDGYYSRYITEHSGDGSALVVDPATNLQSVLFTPDHVRQFFMPELKLMEEKFTDDDDHGQGEKHSRQTYAMLFERNPKSQGGGYGKITPETNTMRPKLHATFPTRDGD